MVVNVEIDGWIFPRSSLVIEPSGMMRLVYMWSSVEAIPITLCMLIRLK